MVEPGALSNQDGSDDPMTKGLRPAQVALNDYLDQRRRAGASADDILDALGGEIREFELMSDRAVLGSDQNPDAANRRAVQAMTDIANTMNMSASNAGNALGTVTSACGNLQSGSMSAVDASETIRRSITDISQQADSASRMINQIAGNVSRAQDNAGRLEGAVTKISSVVELIKAIARQTNLLALNATIEAARVGDAGRGFGVVANEVKALANQTSGATEDIASQVLKIESASHETIELVRRINGDIHGMNDRLRAIADSVRLQEESAGGVVSATTACADAIGGLHEVVGRMTTITQRNGARTKEMSERLKALKV